MENACALKKNIVIIYKFFYQHMQIERMLEMREKNRNKRNRRTKKKANNLQNLDMN